MNPEVAKQLSHILKESAAKSKCMPQIFNVMFLMTMCGKVWLNQYELLGCPVCLPMTLNQPPLIIQLSTHFIPELYPYSSHQFGQRMGNILLGELRVSGSQTSSF